MEFLKVATEIQHPLAAELAVPDVLLQAVQTCLKLGHAEIARRRAQFIILQWTQRAIELKASMDLFVSRGVRNKRILLFEEMLKACHFPDLGVVEEIKRGSDLTGTVPTTGMLPAKVQSSQISGRCAETACLYHPESCHGAHCVFR